MVGFGFGPGPGFCVGLGFLVGLGWLLVGAGGWFVGATVAGAPFGPGLFVGVTRNGDKGVVVWKGMAVTLTTIAVPRELIVIGRSGISAM